MPGKRGNYRTAATVVILALFAIAALGIIAKPLAPGDYWVHLAVVRSLANGTPIQDTPIALDRWSLQRLHDPYHAFWAMVMNHTHLRATDLFVVAGMLNVAILFAGIFFLARSLSSDYRLTVILPIVLLLVWGTGFGWSSEYYLSALPVAAPYTSTLAWGVSLFALGFLNRWLRGGGSGHLITATVLAGLVVMIHALTAIMFTLAFPVLWVWLARVPMRKKLLFMVYPIAGFLISLLWPYNSVFAQLEGVAENGIKIGGNDHGGLFWRPDHMPMALGPIWAGAILIPWIPRQWRRRLGWLTVVYALAWIALIILGVQLGHRVIFFLAFILQLTVAAVVARGWRIWSWRQRRTGVKLNPAVALAVALLLVPWAPLHLWRVAFMCKQRVSIRSHTLKPSLPERYESSCMLLQRNLPPRSIVMVDQRSHRILAAFGVPIAFGGGLEDRVEKEITPDFVDSVRECAARTGSTHLVVDHILMGREKLRPREMEMLEAIGAVSRFSDDFTLVELFPQRGR